jgi:hypothetical protein
MIIEGMALVGVLVYVWVFSKLVDNLFKGDE